VKKGEEVRDEIHIIAEAFLDHYIAGNPTAPTAYVLVDDESRYFHGRLPSGKPIFRDQIEGAQVFYTEEETDLGGTYLPAPSFLVQRKF